MQKSSKHEAQCIKWHKKTVPSKDTVTFLWQRREERNRGGERERRGRQREKKAGKKEKLGRGNRKNILISAGWFFHLATMYCKRTFCRSELSNHQYITSTWEGFGHKQPFSNTHNPSHQGSHNPQWGSPAPLHTELYSLLWRMFIWYLSLVNSKGLAGTRMVCHWQKHHLRALDGRVRRTEEEMSFSTPPPWKLLLKSMVPALPISKNLALWFPHWHNPFGFFPV